MPGIMSISAKKESERERLNREIEEFKANGGEIKKVPSHSAGYGYQNFRMSKEAMAARKPSKPSTFNPKKECRKLLQAENERRAAKREQPILNEKDFLNGKVKPPYDTKLPWEA